MTISIRFLRPSFAYFKAGIRTAFVSILCLLMASCGSGGSGGDSTSNNCGISDCSPQALILNPSLTAYAGQEVRLDGTPSRPSGMLTYRWEQTGGFSVQLVEADKPVATFVTPILEAEQVLTFRLVVSNSYSDSIANIGVVVKPLKVTAIASPALASVGQPVSLLAVGGDESGEQYYHWEQVDNSGIELAIDNAESATAEFSTRVVIEPAAATFLVTLTNKFGAKVQSDVVVNLDAGVIPSITAVTPSRAAAGEPIKISGAGFTNLHGLTLESENAIHELEFQAVSDHEVRFVTPQVVAGNYLLKVANSGGGAAADLSIGQPLENVMKVAHGTAHICAIKTDGSLWCWGENDFGQLGNSTQSDSLSPVAVRSADGSTIADAVEIAAGEVFTCVLREDRRVYCWGNNGVGQLGDGTTENRSAATAIPGLPSEIVAIAAGSYFACALTNSGEVYCWGTNGSGQLGNAVSSGLVPVRVEDAEASRILAIELGDDHACGIVAGDRNLVCWGANASGQLGDGTRAQRSSPGFVQVDGHRVADVLDIALGSGYSCLLFADRNIACWGENEIGQLGIGTTIDNVNPQGIVESVGKSIDSIYAAQSNDGFTGTGGHTCARSTTNELYCWGRNDLGQLGHGDIANRTRMQLVDELKATEVSLGTSGSCAILEDQTLRCWGYGGAKFERESFGAGPLPVTVENLNNIAAISAGGSNRIEASFNCALSNTGVVSCWGHNDKGQLGIGTLLDSATPVPVSLSNVTAIASGGSHSCAVSEGQVFCWGSNTDRNSIYEYIGNFRRTMKLGSDAIDQSLTPLLVNNLANIEAVAAGAEHSCALSRSGDVYCWGDSAGEYPGIGSAAVRISQLPAKATQIAAGASRSCALLESGDVYCWHGSTPTKISMPLGVSILNISVGMNQSCASAVGGSVYCWGGNDFGQLGNGSTTASNVPVEVVGINNAQGVAAGGAGIFFTSYGFSCALQSHNNGSVSCWGVNEFDQLGDGSGISQSTPVPIKGLHGIKQIASGGTHSCALYRDGYVACWGGFFGGQLGQTPLSPRAVLQ